MDIRKSTNFVNSLARGLAVLAVFGEDSPELTLTEVADELNLDRATVRRSLLTLKELGYVAMSENRRFRLTAKILVLGDAFLASHDYWKDVQPILEGLRDQTGDTCLAGVLDGTDILVTAVANSKNLVAVNLYPGKRAPAYCTALGQVLLSGYSTRELGVYLSAAKLTRLTRKTITSKAALKKCLQEVQRAGYRLCDEEIEEGMISIGTPIKSKRGRILAAIGCISMPSRTSRADMRRKIVPLLKEAADEIAQFLPETLDVG
jgi:IclR family pca regulon transcriptional regulator